ncbi:hypothetical protein FS749_007859 [Ceratobasidium sp. UAMH 11750]|nr:hypothetical protein FS749_007859 [Ceratobasidium sp. UAMH 11750]
MFNTNPDSVDWPDVQVVHMRLDPSSLIYGRLPQLSYTLKYPAITHLKSAQQDLGSHGTRLGNAVDLIANSSIGRRRNRGAITGSDGGSSQGHLEEREESGNGDGEELHS